MDIKNPLILGFLYMKQKHCSVLIAAVRQRSAWTAGKGRGCPCVRGCSGGPAPGRDRRQLWGPAGSKGGARAGGHLVLHSHLHGPAATPPQGPDRCPPVPSPARQPRPPPPLGPSLLCHRGSRPVFSLQTPLPQPQPASQQLVTLSGSHLGKAKKTLPQPQLMEQESPSEKGRINSRAGVKDDNPGGGQTTEVLETQRGQGPVHGHTAQPYEHLGVWTSKGRGRPGGVPLPALFPPQQQAPTRTPSVTGSSPPYRRPYAI